MGEDVPNVFNGASEIFFKPIDALDGEYKELPIVNNSVLVTCEDDVTTDNQENLNDVGRIAQNTFSFTCDIDNSESFALDYFTRQRRERLARAQKNLMKSNRT